MTDRVPPPMRVTVKGIFGDRDLTRAQAAEYHRREAEKYLDCSPERAYHLEEIRRNLAWDISDE